jgi:hypothetical protein
MLLESGHVPTSYLKKLVLIIQTKKENMKHLEKIECVGWEFHNPL